MDPVSQVTLGASIGALFQPRLGRKAVVLGGICGGAPDLDVVASLAGPWEMLVHHRGATHSLLVLALAAPVFGWLGYRWAGRQHFGTWTHLAFWALVTHALLDWCTPYGTQLLWPLTTRRFALDAVFSVDPWYTVWLVIATLFALWPWTSARRAQQVALAALLLSTAHLALGWSQSQRAVRMAREQLAATDFQTAEVRAFPAIANVWLRRIVARDEAGRLRVGLLSTWAPARIDFQALELPDDHTVRAALATREGRIFRWFAMEMLSAQVARQRDQTVVTFSDQRYGTYVDPTRAVFQARARFDATGQLVEFRRLPRQFEMDIGAELARMKALTFGTPEVLPAGTAGSAPESAE